MRSLVRRRIHRPQQLRIMRRLVSRRCDVHWRNVRVRQRRTNVLYERRGVSRQQSLVHIGAMRTVWRRRRWMLRGQHVRRGTHVFGWRLWLIDVRRRRSGVLRSRRLRQWLVLRSLLDVPQLWGARNAVLHRRRVQCGRELRSDRHVRVVWQRGQCVLRGRRLQQRSRM